VKILIAVTLHLHTEKNKYYNAMGDISNETAASKLSHCDSPAMILNFRKLIVIKYKLNSDTNGFMFLLHSASQYYFNAHRNKFAGIYLQWQLKKLSVPSWVFL